MTCVACGHPNRDAARFCEACGATMDRSCPGCGNPTRPGARFCDACGRAIAPAAGAPAASAGPSPSRPAAGSIPARDERTPASYTPRHLADRIRADAASLRGARKEVSVLFVDVQGSTELAGALGPEEFHDVMDGAFQLMLDAVHRWEGTINQFTGDGIMALFGAPLAHEDHARRACAAALELRRALAEYAARLRRDRGLTFQVRLGLNSGPVVVGTIGDDLRMDYTAQGLTTNLAARMQQAADPGRILVAAATHRLAEGYFRFDVLGPLHVRGVPEPVDVWTLEGEGRVTSRLEASLRRGASPFRGREIELGRLADAWERVVGAGAGRAVCLVGDPGIGKSRLAFEFRQNLGLAAPVEGAALAHTRSVAYSVFRPLLRHLAGVPGDADLATARDVLHRRLWDLSPELAADAPGLLAVLGTPADSSLPDSAEPEERRDRLREAVLRWIGAECAHAPRLLLVEDLHWLDPSSADLLHHLALAARRLPLLLLMTSRLSVAGSPLELAHVEEIPLRALSADDVRALVDAQVEPYPAGPRLQRVVAARAQGNPFYAEEMVRAFREQGQVALADGRYELAGDAEHALPATVAALIASRVDRLPPPARELLADAAVLGVHFPLAHLRSLAGSERLDEDLALVERRGLLERDAGGGVATVRFRHVLTHDVVSASMLQADRQARHRRAGETLETLYRGRVEEICDRLAHHWAQSDQPRRAVPYLAATAELAVAVGANQEAITHLGAALGLATAHGASIPEAEIVAIRLKLAGLHFIVGER